MNEMIIATKHGGKAEEFKTFFAEYGIKAVSLSELSHEIEDIEETGSTFEKNAELKAEQIAELLQSPVLADDSGLVVDALDGRPGVFSARFAGEPKDDQKNIDKVLAELLEVEAVNRTARIGCVVSGSIQGRETVVGS